MPVSIGTAAISGEESEWLHTRGTSFVQLEETKVVALTVFDLRSWASRSNRCSSLNRSP